MTSLHLYNHPAGQVAGYQHYNQILVTTLMPAELGHCPIKLKVSKVTISSQMSSPLPSGCLQCHEYLQSRVLLIQGL